MVGLPDERYGEVVAAFVVRQERRGSEGDLVEEEEIRGWVREKLSHHLGMFVFSLSWSSKGCFFFFENVYDLFGFANVGDFELAVPKYVFWIDTYPKTESGKIQKFKLREEGVRRVREMEMNGS